MKVTISLRKDGANNQGSRLKLFKLFFSFRDRGHGNAIEFIPFMLSCVLGLSLYFSFAFEFSILIFLWKFASVVGLVILFFWMKISMFKHIFNFNKFIQQQNNTVFDLNDWDKILGNKNLFNDRYWFKECSLSLNLDSYSNQSQELIKTVYAQFCEKSNDIIKLYDGDLYLWRFKNNKLTGSANCTVIGLLHHFILNDINEIQQKTCKINSIEMSYSIPMVLVTIVLPVTYHN